MVLEAQPAVMDIAVALAQHRVSVLQGIASREEIPKSKKHTLQEDILE